MCGGTDVFENGGYDYEGLSPRVRGTLYILTAVPPKHGLSPRVRGNLPRGGVVMRANRVYPRVCGGTDGVRIFGKEYEGLSPRVRGNRDGRAGQV